ATVLPGRAGRDPRADPFLRDPDRVAPARWTGCRRGGTGDSALGFPADRLGAGAHPAQEPAETAAGLVGCHAPWVPGPGGGGARSGTLRPGPGVRPPADGPGDPRP